MWSGIKESPFTTTHVVITQLNKKNHTVRDVNVTQNVLDKSVALLPLKLWFATNNYSFCYQNKVNLIFP